MTAISEQMSSHVPEAYLIGKRGSRIGESKLNDRGRKPAGETRVAISIVRGASALPRSVNRVFIAEAEVTAMLKSQDRAVNYSRSAAVLTLGGATVSLVALFFWASLAFMGGQRLAIFYGVLLAAGLIMYRAGLGKLEKEAEAR